MKYLKAYCFLVYLINLGSGSKMDYVEPKSFSMSKEDVEKLEKVREKYGLHNYSEVFRVLLTKEVASYGRK